MEYEYKFMKIEMKSGFWTDTPKQEYHEIINEQASDGWRFVQIFAPATSGYGSAAYFELIFERPVE
ncbi:DUF4177 domain-containing protein [bacterium]|nr:DUF4177 domain-containing protein [bacterium]